MRVKIAWSPLRACSVVMLIIGVCILSGCIEIGDTAGSPVTPARPAITDNIPAEPPAYLSPDEPARSSAVPVTTSNSANTAPVPGSAEYANPLPPNGAYEPDHRPLSYEPDNTTTPYDYPTAPFFQASYNLGYSNIGILANATTPPFVIEFKTTARNRNPNDALVIISVRDPGTGRIVEEEGYNGRYSSDAVKRIIIRDQGSYHVNIYGYGATVQITLRGGVAPGKAVPYGIFAPLPTQVAASPGEEFFEEVTP